MKVRRFGSGESLRAVKRPVVFRSWVIDWVVFDLERSCGWKHVTICLYNFIIVNLYNYFLIHQYSHLFLPLLFSIPLTAKLFSRSESSLSSNSYSHSFFERYPHSSPFIGGLYPAELYSSSVGFFVSTISTIVRYFFSSILTRPSSFGS